MDVDPRLQVSDLTDYQFQASLAQQYNSFNTNTVQQAHGGLRYAHNAGYFQSVPQDEARTTSLRSTQQPGARSSPQQAQEQRVNTFDIPGLYQRTSIPDSSIGYNPGRSSSDRHNASRAGGLSTPPSSNAGSTPQDKPAIAIRSGGRRSENTETKDPATFVSPHLIAPLRPNPPSLKEWRRKFFNIREPLLLTSEQYLTYFPHVDNIYSHRSTQKYKRKPFVSHYWDCRLKGRPTGTPMNKKKVDENGLEQEKRKRKRKVRERDLCDVKIKVTEYFGKEELEALRKLGLGSDTGSNNIQDEHGDLAFVLNEQQQNENNDSAFGVLEPTQNYSLGHPGAGGRKWYMIQRVSGNEKDAEEVEDKDLDHKHTMEESDQIKKNSVQRWLAAREKEKKKAAKASIIQEHDDDDDDNTTETNLDPPSRFHATGFALQTLYSHREPVTNDLTFFGCSYCPFSQRVWIALELIGIPYRYVEVTEHHWSLPLATGSSPKCNILELQDCNPESIVPCLKHNNFCIWESLVMLEYLEDLAMGQSLFQPAVGNAQIKAHSRLWVDFINRRILPVFYALLLLPDKDNSSTPTLTNIAERSAHANPNSTGYNDESYRMPSSTPSFFPTRSQCDVSSLPPRVPAMPSAEASREYNMKAQTLITTLHTTITTLVNASHRTGPFFLGPTLSYVDIAFAPWIIRLSRILSYYRGFPRPEVGSRWQAWCDAIESNEVIKRTVSEEKNYQEVYGGGSNWQYDRNGRVDFIGARMNKSSFPEMGYARRVVETEGFGLGGDVWGRLAGEGPGAGNGWPEQPRMDG